jgi:hypothetical protein
MLLRIDANAIYDQDLRSRQLQYSMPKARWGRTAAMPKPALADCQKRARAECSSLRYQVPIMRMNPGDIVHSKRPWSARSAMSCAQFCAAAMQITQMPARPGRISRSGWEQMPVLTPAEHVDGQRAAEGPSLEQEVGRELAAKVRDVEAAINQHP